MALQNSYNLMRRYLLWTWNKKYLLFFFLFLSIFVILSVCYFRWFLLIIFKCSTKSRNWHVLEIYVVSVILWEVIYFAHLFSKINAPCTLQILSSVWYNNCHFTIYNLLTRVNLEIIIFNISNIFFYYVYISKSLQIAIYYALCT